MFRRAAPKGRDSLRIPDKGLADLLGTVAALLAASCRGLARLASPESNRHPIQRTAMRPILALLLTLGVSGCAQAVPVYDRVHGATLQLTNGRAGCSATALSQHIILTASHCFEHGPNGPIAPRQLTLNGETCEVWKLIHDGQDHSLIKVTGCKFSATVKVGKPARVGDRVFCWGNPLDFQDLLRFGSLAGYVKGEMPTVGKVNVSLWQLPIDRGDSGSAIFNEAGEVVAVVSIGTRPYSMAGSFPLAFTRKQWKEAGL